MIRKIFGTSWSLWPAPVVSKRCEKRKVEPIYRVTNDLEQYDLEVYNSKGRLEKHVCQRLKRGDTD